MSSAITKTLVPTLDVITPQSVAAAGTAATGWIDASKAHNIITRMNNGALGGGTVALTFTQAKADAAGDADNGTSKALSAWTGLAASGAVDNDPGKLDVNNGFKFFKATATVTGGSGALVSAVVEAGGPRYTDAV